MPANFQTELYTKEYEAQCEILSQAHSIFNGLIDDKGTRTGEEAYFNQSHSWDMTFGRARNSDTQYLDPQYTRRRITPEIATAAVPLDKIDTVRSLVNPQSVIARNGYYAAGRAKDKIIWNGMFGTAYTGKGGTTAVNFSTDQIVDVQVGGSAADTGLNITKLLKAIQMLEDQNIDVTDPMNELSLIYAPQQKNDLMSIANLQSFDYMGGKALVTGRFDGLLGIPNIRRSTMVPYCNAAETGADVDLDGVNAAWGANGNANDIAGNSNRAVILMCRSAVSWASWANLRVETAELPEKNYLWQLWLEFQGGAARMEETKLVLIECNEE